MLPQEVDQGKAAAPTTTEVFFHLHNKAQVIPEEEVDSVHPQLEDLLAAHLPQEGPQGCQVAGRRDTQEEAMACFRQRLMVFPDKIFGAHMLTTLYSTQETG